MTWIKSLLLGILQGLTEFLPISSSGHLELFQTLFKVPKEEHLLFDVVVHLATVMSIFTVYRKDIFQLIVEGISLKKDAVQYLLLLVVSAVPAGVVGLLFKETIEEALFGNLWVVATGFLVTALLLLLSRWRNESGGSISWGKSFLLGIAQAVAIIPGLSRSGSTISTALLLQVRREEAVKFAFLMLPIPVLGATVLELADLVSQANSSPMPGLVLLVGFLSAYITGILACRWVIALVNKDRFHWFGYYCLGASLITFFLAWAHQ